MITTLDEKNVKAPPPKTIAIFRNYLDANIYYKQHDGKVKPVKESSGIYKIQNIHSQLEFENYLNQTGEELEKIHFTGQEFFFRLFENKNIIISGTRKKVVNNNTIGGITTEEGIVAFPGGGQINATELTANYSMMDEVAAAGDSVKFSAAIKNTLKKVFNYGANDMDLFPASGERFKNGNTLMPVNAALSISPFNAIEMVCYSNGIWRF